MTKKYRLTILYILMTLTSSCIYTSCKPGIDGPYKLVRVVDGDTIVIKRNIPFYKPIKVRIACADTPESKFFGHAQYIDKINIGDMASDVTHDFLSRAKYVYFKPDSDKSYNRYVGSLYIKDKQNRIYLNMYLIVTGYAYASKRYCSEIYINAMKQAKENKEGLWALDQDWEPPMDFRKRLRKSWRKSKP
jgi:endonuclease YncB( thermonuclease family)